MLRGKDFIVPWFLGVFLGTSMIALGAETTAATDTDASIQAIAADDLPSAFVVTLRASRPGMPSPFVLTLQGQRQTLPAPFTVVLRSMHPHLPSPFRVDLQAGHPTLPPPFAIVLEANRPSLPAPMQVTLRASRLTLPDPFALQLDAHRTTLPAPYAVVLRALREPDLIAVPGVIGKPLDEAARLVGEVGFQPSPEMGDPARERKQVPGHVYETVPEPGGRLAAGQPMVLKAYGPRPIKVVPDVKFLDFKAASDIIAAANFDLTDPALGPPAPAGVEPGMAAGTDPPAGSEKAIFTEVTILLFGPHAAGERDANADGTTTTTLVEPPPPPPDPEPPVILPPPAPEPAPEPPSPADGDFADIWLGRWELTSTTFKIPRLIGDQIVHMPVKQIIEIRRRGDRIVGTISSQAEAMAPYLPSFGENRMTADITGEAGSRYRLELTQGSGSCSGMISGKGAAIVQGRVQGFLDVSWTLTCVRLSD